MITFDKLRRFWTNVFPVRSGKRGPAISNTLTYRDDKDNTFDAALGPLGALSSNRSASW
jgi:hypothetical protein